MSAAVETLENGDVTVANPSGFIETYRAIHGRVYRVWENGAKTEAKEGLRTTGYFLDIDPQANLEAVIRAQIGA